MSDSYQPRNPAKLALRPVDSIPNILIKPSTACFFSIGRGTRFRARQAVQSMIAVGTPSAAAE